jgi:hypothetical protein
MNFFPIYKGLEGATDKKMLNSSLIGTLSCFAIYSTTGLLGYFHMEMELHHQTF